MAHKVYNKLVRDNIPEVIEADGLIPKTRILGTGALRQALVKKLGEETTEFNEANTPDKQLAELADLQEVVDALTRLSGFTLAERHNVQKQKLEDRGGFEQGIFLESVIEPEI